MIYEDIANKDFESIIEAIDMMIQICNEPERVKGMESVKEMIMAFSSTEAWNKSKKKGYVYGWLAQFLYPDWWR